MAACAASKLQWPYTPGTPGLSQLTCTAEEGEPQAKNASGQTEWTVVRRVRKIQSFKATSFKESRLQRPEGLPAGRKQLIYDKQLNHTGLPSLVSINRFSALASPNHHHKVQEQEICFSDFLKSSPPVSSIPKGGKWKGRPSGIRRTVQEKHQRRSQKKAPGQHEHIEIHRAMSLDWNVCALSERQKKSRQGPGLGLIPLVSGLFRQVRTSCGG